MLDQVGPKQSESFWVPAVQLTEFFSSFEMNPFHKCRRKKTLDGGLFWV